MISSSEELQISNASFLVLPLEQFLTFFGLLLHVP